MIRFDIRLGGATVPSGGSFAETDPHNMPRLLPSFGKGVYVNEIEVVDLPLETIGGRRFETLAELQDWFEGQKRDRAERLSQGLPAESTLFTPPGMDFGDSWWDRVQRVYWTWHHFLTQGKQHD